MEALADAIGLGAFGFAAAVVNVLNREIELVLVGTSKNAEMGVISSGE
jgi:hypothetical protein